MPTKKPSITERLRNIIVEELGVLPDQVIPEAKLDEDLGADSLDLVKLAVYVEYEFGIDIMDEDAEKCTTVGECIACIEKTLAS